jgi:1-acyl-sn-glycerol-3-phosphate acyltransferase
MTSAKDICEIMNPPDRVAALHGPVNTITHAAEPLVDLYRPYVDGLENLPRDGRFLLVGNHTQAGLEAPLIPHYVRREIGTRVRPLTERMMAKFPKPVGDLLAAYGAVVGSREGTREMMRHGETILVFPGGGREIGKFKGEEYTLQWQGRSGFALLSVENDYPIVPVALVGGDDVYRNLISRGNPLAKLSAAVSAKIHGRAGMTPAVLRGVGPTLIPRPQRMYLRFAEPVATTQPDGVSAEDWIAEVKRQTQQSLETAMAELLELRRDDPYRELNPLAWRNALQPALSA